MFTITNWTERLNQDIGYWDFVGGIEATAKTFVTRAPHEAVVEIPWLRVAEMVSRS